VIRSGATTLVAEDVAAETSVVASALDEFASGRPVVLLTTGLSVTPPQLVVAAERIEVSGMAFLVRHTSGFICVYLRSVRCDELILPIFANDKCSVGEPLPGVCVDAIEGVGTGISAADRCRTTRRLADANSTAQDFRRPGHVVPLRVPDACRARADSVAAAALGLCLCQLTGVTEATVMGDLVADDGEVMTAAQAASFGVRHALTCVHVSQVMQLVIPLRARGFR
jgi:3,4-dihydroxy 2-butanone 4-phosphate synthase / GTP cyclohydrolase II